MSDKSTMPTADCPVCEAKDGLVCRGDIFVRDDLVARKSFICTCCHFTVGVNIEGLADARALKGDSGCRAHLSAQVTAAYSAFRQKRRDAGLDA